MICKNCGNDALHVVYTRHLNDNQKIERRRKCTKCGLRITTQEKLKELKKKGSANEKP